MAVIDHLYNMKKMLDEFDNIPNRSVEKVDAAINIIEYAINSYFFNSRKFKTSVINKIGELTNSIYQIGLDDGVVINYKSDLNVLLIRATELEI